MLSCVAQFVFVSVHREKGESRLVATIYKTLEVQSNTFSFHIIIERTTSIHRDYRHSPPANLRFKASNSIKEDKSIDIAVIHACNREDIFLMMSTEPD